MRYILICAAALFLQACQPAAAETRPVSFRVDVKGKGRPMILIPGLSSAGEVWEGTVARFSDRYECHVLTLAGFAGVPRVDAPLLETARKDLARYIRENGMQKPAIVGHSLGGFLALSLAAEEPTLPGALIIVDSLPFLAGTWPGIKNVEAASKQATMLRKMIGGQPQESYEAFVRGGASLKPMITGEADLARAIDWSLKSDRTAVADAMFELMTTDLRPVLPKIQSPALVLGSWIGMKEYTTREAVEIIFKEQYTGLASYQFILSDDAKHFLMLDAPQWFYQTLETYLKSPASGRR
jgi:pimeloyl-ACP methyl ester carboxylesterase